MKHKHYDCIVAWAEGKKIEFRTQDSPVWYECIVDPAWREDFEYRIMSEITTAILYISKDIVVKGLSIHSPYYYNKIVAGSENANLELIFDNDKLVSAIVL